MEFDIQEKTHMGYAMFEKFGLRGFFPILYRNQGLEFLSF